MNKRFAKYKLACGSFLRIASRYLTRIGAVLIGFMALVWFLVRVVPKPSRAAYPCQRAAFPLASAFVLYVLGIIAAGQRFYVARRHAICFRIFEAALAAIAGFGILFMMFSINPVANLADFIPSDPANQPIGSPKGIFPGRVVWVHDPNSTQWDGSTGNWWESQYTNRIALESMMSNGIRAVSGQVTDQGAWEHLFRNSNLNRQRGDRGYQQGEIVALKINVNNEYEANAIDANPELVSVFLNQLIHQAQVPPQSIFVYDAVRTLDGPVKQRCQQEFPGVQFNSSITWVPNAISYSDPSIPNGPKYLPQEVLSADYLINCAILKNHKLRSAITLCGKNHFGSIMDPGDLHPYIACWINGPDTYDPQVDLMGHQELGGKTILYCLDSLYTSDGWNKGPKKWNLAPFNNSWPSSLFFSLDPVAIDSVGLDFIRAEFIVRDFADNYLHEAAMAHDPPSGTFYDPEDDGSRLNSLGVHEHWNSPEDKLYSGNFSIPGGIELLYLGSASDAQALIADFDGNKKINSLDLIELTEVWLTSFDQGQWNPIFDIGPLPQGDQKIDFEDFHAFSRFWMEAQCSEYYRTDFNGDCQVTFLDLIEFSESWLSQPGHNNWHSIFNVAQTEQNEIINMEDYEMLSNEYEK